MLKERNFRNELILDNDKIIIKLKRRKMYLVRWVLLLLEYIKINFDDLIRGKRVIVGFIIRDYFKKLLKVGMINLGKVLCWFQSVLMIIK